MYLKKFICYCLIISLSPITGLSLSTPITEEQFDAEHYRAVSLAQEANTYDMSHRPDATPPRPYTAFIDENENQSFRRRVQALRQDIVSTRCMTTISLAALALVTFLVMKYLIPNHAK